MSKEDAFKELLKQIADFYNKVVTETDAKKISFFIQQYVDTLPPRIKVEKEVKTIYMPERVTNVPQRTTDVELFLNELAENICENHQITMQQLKRNKRIPRGTRLRRFVNARQEFSNIAVASGVSKVEIGKYLGYSEHSSIVHLTIYRESQKTFVQANSPPSHQ